MKDVVLCFDGTWNTDADTKDPPTNVERLRRLLVEDEAQSVWYDPGVGTDWYDRIRGGVTGEGLSHNIRKGYAHLSQIWEDGDRIWLFGFSRGAFTARSLAGMLRKCWLPRAAGEDLVEKAYDVYRIREGGADGPEALAFRDENNCRQVRVHFIGVWDTVGSLGIPLPIARALNEEFNGFHDTRLSSTVRYAYHAVAIDEHRVDYDVTLWDDVSEPNPNQTVEQRWFAGAHANVGGGYPDQQLANITLQWMIARARRAVSEGFSSGLRIDDPKAPEAVTSTSYQGLLRDSYRDFLGKVYRLLHRPFYRTITLGPHSNETVDPSVAGRVDSPPPGQPPYEPENLMALGSLWRQYLGN
jgi:uncharacterized protein (DUF2235 family)